MNEYSRRILWHSILAVAALLLLIALNWLAFRFIAHENYFLWYVKDGALIGVLVSFVALIWEGLSQRNDLLSAQPLYYLQGCFALMAAFYYSVAAQLAPTSVGTRPGKDAFQIPVPEFAFPLDDVLAFVIFLVLFILGLAWLLIIAPMNYFVTLLTGVIARRQLAQKGCRAIAVQSGDTTSFESRPWNETLSDKAIDISLAAKPFAVTQAITALVLFVAKAVLVPA